MVKGEEEEEAGDHGSKSQKMVTEEDSGESEEEEEEEEDGNHGNKMVTDEEDEEVEDDQEDEDDEEREEEEEDELEGVEMESKDSELVSTEQSCLILQYILQCLTKCFLYDKTGFLTRERFDSLLLPLVGQVRQCCVGIYLVQ
jgi:hypothetical protein